MDSETFSLPGHFGVGFHLGIERGEKMWRVALWRGKSKVGWAYCFDYRPVLKIYEIQIRPLLGCPENGWQRLLRRALRRRRPTYDPRGKGLGSALLNYVIREAKLQGFTAVEGFITAQDLAADPRLPEWFKGRGFEVDQYASGTVYVLRLRRSLV